MVWDLFVNVYWVCVVVSWELLMVCVLFVVDCWRLAVVCDGFLFMVV